MPFINPSVGRIVHFYTKDAARQSNGQGEGPYPAIILQTFDPSGESGMCNLFVMSYGGNYNASSVGEKSWAKKADHVAWWEWPPRV